MTNDTHLSLLAENYIRWRHGMIGTADADVVTRTAQALSTAVGQDVSLLSDADLLELVGKAQYISSHFGDKHIHSALQAPKTEPITGNAEADPLLPQSFKRTKKGEGN